MIGYSEGQLAPSFVEGESMVAPLSRAYMLEYFLL